MNDLKLELANTTLAEYIGVTVFLSSGFVRIAQPYFANRVQLEIARLTLPEGAVSAERIDGISWQLCSELEEELSRSVVESLANEAPFDDDTKQECIIEATQDVADSYFNGEDGEASLFEYDIGLADDNLRRINAA